MNGRNQVFTGVILIIKSCIRLSSGQCISRSTNPVIRLC